jgi:hypothetical protein
MQRMINHQLVLHKSRECIMKSKKPSTNTCSAGSTVCLQHVAIDYYLTLAKQGHVTRGAQRPANETLNFNSASALFSFGSLAVDALR